MHDGVYVENRLCPIILGHICSWKILKLSDFLFFTGWRNTIICDFTGWRNICMIWYM